MPAFGSFLQKVFFAAMALAPWLVGQHPAPQLEGNDPARACLARGERSLALRDPLLAWREFQRAQAASAPAVPCQIGLGRAQLLLGHAAAALQFADAALAQEPLQQQAMALQVLALIRNREFERAVQVAQEHLQQIDYPVAELYAARASALFRVQSIDAAAANYQLAQRLDPRHAEAHLRLGSGLLPPCEVVIAEPLRRAVAHARASEWEPACALLQQQLASEPQHPVAHRLLGEALFAAAFAASMPAQDPAFARLRANLPQPDAADWPIASFVRGYDQLDPARRLVVQGAVALFASRLDRLIAVGCSHDLLHELERTTDHLSRSNLRGRRTFDGRVWDDVRGVGGLHAATGIEALDEANQFSFNTLAHEIAHQVHFYALNPLQRARIKALYRAAVAEDRFLDYYAATNEAEYFGQGVEAFCSLAKSPGLETTHGHTRFELARVDPDLHAFLLTLVDVDALAGPNREELLRSAAAVALRVGRVADARIAALWLSDPAERQALLAEVHALEAADPAPR